MRIRTVNHDDGTVFVPQNQEPRPGRDLSHARNGLCGSDKEDQHDDEPLSQRGPGHPRDRSGS